MKVLVTGGCGFIGSHTCEYYAAKGDQVISYDNLTKFELARTGYNTQAARDYNWNLLRKLGVEMIKADVRDYARLRHAAEDCDFVVHTAAQPAMTISIERPDLDSTTNVLGTLNVLRIGRELEIPVVTCSTIHVYGNRINETLHENTTRYLREPAEIDESHPIMEGALTPLHASKRAAELYVQTFVDTYGVEAAAFRLTGLYGPRQLGGEDHGWVANFCIRAILGWPLTLYGTGKQVRDILFATDVAHAFDAFYQNRTPGIYNVGGGQQRAISLLECIELIGQILGKEPTVEYAPSRPGDLQYFVCNTAKAQHDLAWSPSVYPQQGVQLLIEWIDQHPGLFAQE